MNEKTYPALIYCKKCKSLYYIIKGCRTIYNKKTGKKAKIEFEILVCNCEHIILVNESQRHWQEFPFKLKEFPIFDKSRRRLVFNESRSMVNRNNPKP